MSGWNTQKRMLKTHNLFYSTLNGYIDNGLIDAGYKLVGENVEMPDERRGVTIFPDYVLYDGRTVVFVGIIDGQYISEEKQEEIDQWNRIGLEGVREYLKRADARERDLEPSNAEEFDFWMVVRDDLFNPLSSDPDSLAEIFGTYCVVSVSPGGTVGLEHNTPRDTNLVSTLDGGISLPTKPPNTRLLTPSVHKESLAVAICQDILLPSLESNESDNLKTIVSVSDIRNHFGSDIERGKISEVAEFLANQSACRWQDDENKITFTDGHISNALRIESKLRNKGVEDYLYEESEQTSLEDVSS